MKNALLAASLAGCFTALVPTLSHNEAREATQSIALHEEVTSGQSAAQLSLQLPTQQVAYRVKSVTVTLGAARAGAGYHFPVLEGFVVKLAVNGITMAAFPHQVDKGALALNLADGITVPPLARVAWTVQPASRRHFKAEVPAHTTFTVTALGVVESAVPASDPSVESVARYAEREVPAPVPITTLALGTVPAGETWRISDLMVTAGESSVSGPAVVRLLVDGVVKAAFEHNASNAGASFHFPNGSLAIPTGASVSAVISAANKPALESGLYSVSLLGTVRR